MKKTFAALLLLSSLTAKAQFLPLATEPDKQCFVELQRPDGSKKKALVPRQAHVRLSKNELNVAFLAKRYNGGETQTADFIFEDVKTKKMSILTSTIGPNWTWDFEFESKYGVAHVTCGNGFN